MENTYAMEAYGQKFIVNFDFHYIEEPEYRKITTCTIIETDGKSIYAGATIKHPCDIHDTWTARKWAYKRAIMMMFLIWTTLKKTSVNFTCFWKTFRLGLAKNELYLRDKREGKYE